MTPSLFFADYEALSPLLTLLAGALIILLIESFAQKVAQRYSIFLTLFTLGLALIFAIQGPVSQNPVLTSWLKFDTLTYFFTIFFLSIGIGAALLGNAFFQRFEASHGEYYFLLLSALFGLILIGSAADFLTLFLGIETLSISLYVLCGYMRKWSISNEAAIKYFIMGSLAAAFLVYGIAMVYGAIGTTRLDALLNSYKGIANISDQALFFAGISLITLGLAFEAAIVPFHIWAPDVYDGAPTPVAAFMSIGTKVGAFAAFVRVFYDALPHFNPLWNEVIAFLIYPTLLYANIVALRQTHLRRFFAYSGISHAGFLLIPFVVETPDAMSALYFYLVVYAIATFGAFAVIAFLDRESQGVNINDLKGLFQRSPYLASILALSLLTLAGIPPTAGFFAKFFLFKVAFQAGYHGLVIFALLVTIVSAFYYLRFIAIMLAEAPEQLNKPDPLWSATVVGTFSFVAILVLSCYPALLFK